MTKKAMTERCRKILHNQTEVTGEDFDFIMQILNRHTEADRKIGCGVKRIWTDQNPVYTHTKCFYLERFDGTTTDFSFTHCVSPKDDFKSACRNAIHPQIREFRKLNNMSRDRHADHHPESFDSLLSRFVKEHGKCKVIPTEDNKIGCFLADENYKQKWCEFHKQEAKLRDVPWQVNLSKKHDTSNRHYRTT